MNQRPVNRVILASIVALALPAASLAAPQGEVEEVTVKVDFSDLNIHSEAGAQRLYDRLQRASRKACDVHPYREHGSIQYYKQTRACYDSTLAEAVLEIESKALAKLHAST